MLLSQAHENLLLLRWIRKKWENQLYYSARWRLQRRTAKQRDMVQAGCVSKRWHRDDRLRWEASSHDKATFSKLFQRR